MAHIDLIPAVLRLRLTPFERIAGLLRDRHAPLAAVREVDVVSDGLAAARGLRAPGLGVPGICKIGTWRGRSVRRLVAVRRGEPALRIGLEGQRYDEWLVSMPDAHAVVGRLRATAPPLQR